MTMNEEIEIEFKNLLTKSEYHALIRAFQIDTNTAFIQTNVYFDTYKKTLSNQYAALRLRLLSSYGEITLKQPLERGLLETTQTLSLEEAKKIKKASQLVEFLEEPMINKLNSLNVSLNELDIIGTLTTERLEYLLAEDIKLVLDHSWYANQEDYELELEVKDWKKGQEKFQFILEKYGIQQRPTQNKIQRAIKFHS